MVAVPLIAGNGLHKTSKGMREMNYQDTQQFERATMPNNPPKPLLVLCSVMPRFYFFDFQLLKKHYTIK
jgi:predicted cupin superfamily sugar epimerase